MKTLGKIFILLMITTGLFAQIKAYFSHEKIYKGDEVDLIIESNEDNTEFPDFQRIGPYKVEGTSSSKNLTIINGERKVTEKRVYRLYPQESFVLNSLKIKADGKTFTTEPIKIDVVPPAQTKDPLFRFTISAQKEEVYVGESFLLTLDFDYDERLDLKNLYFDINNLGDLLFKELNKNWKRTNSLKRVQFRNQILITPIKSGELEISEQQIIAEFRQRDKFSMFGNSVQKKVFSNPISLKVKELPSGAELVGKYEISSQVDKNTIDAKEAVTVTYEVVGQGDLENFQLTFPKVSGVTIFEDKSTLEQRVVDNQIESKKTFKAAYVGERDFTIPSVVLTYLDKTDGEVVTKRTKTHTITVKNTPKQTSNTDSKDREVLLAPEKDSKNISNESSIWEKVIYLFGGVFIGLVLGLFIKKGENKEDSREKIAFGKGNRKDLYNQLLSFSDDKDAKILLRELEEEIYQGKNSSIKTKEIKEFIKKKLKR